MWVMEHRKLVNFDLSSCLESRRSKCSAVEKAEKFMGFFDGRAAIRSATTVVVVCALLGGYPMAFEEER